MILGKTGSLESSKWALKDKLLGLEKTPLD